MLHAIGMFDLKDMTNEEKAQDPAEYRTWFYLGETCMAALLAGNIAVPAGFWFAGITALPWRSSVQQYCSCRSSSSCPGRFGSP